VAAPAGPDPRDIRLVVFDVDGVLTDGRLYFLPDGTELKVFHVRDGLGIRRLREAGIEVAVISGRESPLVVRRMQSLGVEHVHQGSDDKLSVFHALLTELQLAPEQTACVGDDVLDLPVMRAAGLGVAVADAHPEVRAAADWVTRLEGGRGAAREVCDRLLAARHGD